MLESLYSSFAPASLPARVKFGSVCFGVIMAEAWDHSFFLFLTQKLFSTGKQCGLWTKLLSAAGDLYGDQTSVWWRRQRQEPKTSPTVLPVFIFFRIYILMTLCEKERLSWSAIQHVTKYKIVKREYCLVRSRVWGLSLSVSTLPLGRGLIPVLPDTKHTIFSWVRNDSWSTAS